MFNKLFSIFIKDNNNIESEVVRAKYGKVSNVLGIVLNVLLCVLKIIVGFLTASVAVIADAINNLADASSNIVGFIGFKLAERPADEEHPYGHGRYEYIAGLTVAFFIMVIGFELFMSGVEKIISPTLVSLSVASIIILSASIVIKLFMCAMYRFAGKKIKSSALIASSIDSRNDAVSTFAVLVSLIITKYTNFVIDGYVGVLIAVFILIGGVKVVKDMITPLLGQAPDKDYVEKVKNKLLSYEGVLGVHDLIVHDYGPVRKLASVHLEMSSEDDVFKSHELIDAIEREFSEQMNLHLVIHYDPISVNDELTNELKDFISNAVKDLNNEFSIHDLRIVRGVEVNIVLFDLVVPFNVKFSEKELKATLNETVKSKYNNFTANITIDRSYVSTK
ncbi:MAG: cation diffusion facilitator family transporter [Clostridia bacterium]|nr:cation diffusion facilitator family transporter [Clostridia bacterium]